MEKNINLGYEIELESILTRNELEKKIWEIKLKFKNDKGGYDIPKKYLKTIEVLKMTIEHILRADEQRENLLKELRETKLELVKFSAGYGKLRIQNMKLKGQSEF